MKHIQDKRGFTLVECMIMVLILMISLSGAVSFRYFAVLNAERAEDQLLAARTAQVLSDAWRGQMGAADFDPTQQGFDDDFQIQAAALTEKSGWSFGTGNSLGIYRIVIEGRTFQAFLAYEDDSSVHNVRLLHITLIWQDRKLGNQQFQMSTLTRTNA